jgi:hypothetical protein
MTVSRVTETVRQVLKRLDSEAVALAADQDEGGEPDFNLEGNTEAEREAVAKHFRAVRRQYRYQRWYSEAMPLMRQLMPDRYVEFCEQYRLSKPVKELGVTTYTVSDFLNGIVVTQGGNPVFEPQFLYHQRVNNQAAILRSALQRVDSAVSDIRLALQAELLDDEIATARELLRKKHLRAAGAVAGVALEAHLASVLQSRSVTVSKKHPALADLNEALKREGIVDTPRWRQIGRLADIRNYCVHSKEREPTASEVADLINGAEDAIKTLF